jgi:tetratricopeptide (TPR) repeat protein
MDFKNLGYINSHFSKILLIIIFTFLATGIKLNAQDTLTSSKVEIKTYNLYMSGNWPELISLGNKAIKEEYDYFYLRMRIGIAYYEKKNYRLAENHFKKALEFNSNDALALEYLYYCYAFTGRTEEARKLSTTFSSELLSKLSIDNVSPIDFLMIEGGSKISDSNQYASSDTSISDYFYDPATYVQIGLKHSLKNKISLFHAFTLYSQKSYAGNSRQLQYYISGAIQLKNNWLISPSFHIANTNFNSTYSYTIGSQEYTTESTTNSNTYVSSISIQKSINKFDLSIGTTLLNNSNDNHFNHFGSIIYSPLGNSKLIIGATGYLHTIDSYSTVNMALSPFVYIAPTKLVSVKLAYLYNQGNNIIENNGYLVNNSSDLTTSRFSIQANFKISKNVSFYTVYQLETKEQSTEAFSYNYNVILGGLKITP